MFEIVFQFLGELLLQILFEFLAELGIYSLADTFKKPKHPVLSTIGYVLWGAIAGGISLWIMPSSFISDPDLRVANLILTPIAIGGMMVLLGKLRAKKGQKLVKLDKFGYAFSFAFAMSLVRFIWAQ